MRQNASKFAIFALSAALSGHAVATSAQTTDSKEKKTAFACNRNAMTKQQCKR